MKNILKKMIEVVVIGLVCLAWFKLDKMISGWVNTTTHSWRNFLFLATFFLAIMSLKRFSIIFGDKFVSNIIGGLYAARGILLGIALTGQYSNSILMVLRRVLLDAYQALDFLPKFLVCAMVILVNFVVGFSFSQIKLTRTKKGGEMCIE